MKIKVKVTQDHIDASRYLLGNTKYHDFHYDECCPIAIALMQMGYDKVVVGNEAVGIEANKDLKGGLSAESYVLPKKAKDFIWEFDNYRTAKPIAFYMEEIDGD